MIIDRAEHPDWLSNAYLVAEDEGAPTRSGVLVDGNGVIQPLLDRIEREDITITHILLTHHHIDHVIDVPELAKRFGVPVVGHPLTQQELGADVVTETIEDGGKLRSGELEIEAIHTPGHAAGHLAFLFDGTDVITADVLFKGTVGGTLAPGHTTFADLKGSVMRLLELPGETRVHPGHREATTVAEETENNPFVRVWRGVDPEGTDTCKVGEDEATLVLWAPDYDGGNKAWVRFPSGEDEIVGGSRVTR